MLVPGSLVLGFQALVLPILVVLLLAWVRSKWNESLERKEEIRRLVETVSRETELAEFHSVREYECFSPPTPPPPTAAVPPYYYQHQPQPEAEPEPEAQLPQQQLRAHRCAVCLSPTTTRCSRCKSVHYCSGKCQIIHWRGGHKDECQPTINLKQGGDFGLREGTQENPETCVGKDDLAEFPSGEEVCLGRAGGAAGSSFEDVTSDNIRTREVSRRRQETRLPPEKFNRAVGKGGASMASKGKKVKSRDCEVSDNKSELTSGNLMSSDVQPGRLVHKKSTRRTVSSEMLFEDSSKGKSSTGTSCSISDAGPEEVDAGKRLVKGKSSRSFSFDACGDHAPDARKSSKRSLWTKVQQFKASRLSYSPKTIFPYEMFVELYSYCEELCPFGLINCGNSCYANAVLQCLAFTRPLTSYLMRGLHSAACRMKEWCFVCELEILVLKGRGGESPLSPIRILSKVNKIGSHLGRGTEEDAHEFLRYAVDTMQSVFLKEAGALGPQAEETTLIGLTFGGYLRSKITCMRCLCESERCERIMDLTVEVDGNIESLDEAFTQFTAEEVLDGANKYFCNRCKSFVKARKKLSILEAPNILTIVLKRFQSGNFHKLDKTVRFPEVFDVAPYMRGKGDKSPHYSLYAVVVHRGIMNDASAGHYLCYVKNSCGEWFGINDSMVISVEPERVLLEEAYMLLYARHHPRGPSLLTSNASSHGGKAKKRNLEAVPSSSVPSNTAPDSHFLKMNHSKAQQEHIKHNCRPGPDDFSNNRLHDSDDWRFYRVPRASPLDSSSESSSIFSSSDASSCSTTSTKDSVRSDDFTDFLFGEVGPGWYGRLGSSSDSAAPALYRNVDSESLRKRDTWRPPCPGNDYR